VPTVTVERYIEKEYTVAMGLLGSMPFTPFHLGPALFLGLLLLRFLDFPTFLIANVIVDVEPLLVLVFSLDYPLHGFFHSFIGGTVVALFLALVMNRIRETVSPLLALFRVEQRSSLNSILCASMFGVYLHILLDARIYGDIRPLYPLNANPFLIQTALPGLLESMFCVWCFFGATIVYVIKLFRIWRTRRGPKSNS
jgi:membrane-bound metal-dependent hydrolase YbcI (DUF457 family)